MVGIDIIRHHLHTAKWGLFVCNNNNKNRKVPRSVGLFEDLVQFIVLFIIPRTLFAASVSSFSQVEMTPPKRFLWPVVGQQIENNFSVTSSVCLYSDRS